MNTSFDKLKQNENNTNSAQAIQSINDRLKHLDDLMKDLSEKMLSKSTRQLYNDETAKVVNLRQVQLGQTGTQDATHLMTLSHGQIINLFTNLLTFQTASRCSKELSCENIEKYLKRIEQSSLVQADQDLQEVCRLTSLVNFSMKHFILE